MKIEASKLKIYLIAYLLFKIINYIIRCWRYCSYLTYSLERLALDEFLNKDLEVRRVLQTNFF